MSGSDVEDGGVGGLEFLIGNIQVDGDLADDFLDSVSACALHVTVK